MSIDTPPLSISGIEGGFNVEQEQYEEEVKVVLFPDRQEVTSDDLATMPDLVRERVRHFVGEHFKCCLNFANYLLTVVCLSVFRKRPYHCHGRVVLNPFIHS